MGKVYLPPSPGLTQTGPPPNANNQTYGFRYKGNGDPSGVILGYEGDQYIDLDTGSEWNKLVDDNGGKPSKTGWYHQSTPLNIGAFPGADPTGGDSSVAVQAAYNALSSTDGGELFFPLGDWKFNLVVTKPNVTISGVSHARDFTATMHSRFTPADNTKPVIQVGNDTGFVKGVVIRNVTLDGKNAGAMGLYLAGGAFECTIQNVVVNFFTVCIKVQAGTTYPASINRFQSVDGQPRNADGARGILLVNSPNYPTSYTTETNFTDCHWDGPSSGSNAYMMEVDSCEIKMVNCYFDITNGHGLKLSHNQPPVPWVDAINSNLDSGSSTNVAIEGYSNDRNFMGLSTFNYQINGTWKELDGTIISQLPQKITSILRKSSAVRGTLILLNQGAGDGTSLLQARDQINNKNPDIFFQNGSINLRAENGGAIKFGNISGGNWGQINGTDGATFFFGAGLNANTVPYLDANNQLKSSPSTGTGTTVVLSSSPTVTSPTFIGGTLTPVQINSPSGQTIAALRFLDTVNSKASDVWGQNGSIWLRGAAGGAVRLTDINGVSKFQINADDGGAFFFGASLNGNSIPYLDSNGQLKSILPIITAPGTTGAQTISKPSGRVNFAAGAQTLVVTSSLVTTSSAIMATIKTDDATAKSVIVSAQGAGSFTLKLNATATAETAVDFLVLN